MLYSRVGYLGAGKKRQRQKALSALELHYIMKDPLQGAISATEVPSYLLSFTVIVLRSILLGLKHCTWHRGHKLGQTHYCILAPVEFQCSGLRL